MKIEAVTVCIDFADKLEKIISNKSKLDRWIIVTHESDLDTIKLCQKNDIEFVCSKRVFDDASFAKGRAINDGLALLNKTDWLLHIDADQKLPEDFTQIVSTECNNKNLLYGCYRKDEHGNSLEKGQHTTKISASPSGRPRIVKRRLILPIGYFQLWHSSVCQKYEEHSLTGDKDDMFFMNKWNTSSANNIKILNMNTTDVSGSQGHYQGHYIGIRNLKSK